MTESEKLMLDAVDTFGWHSVLKDLLKRAEAAEAARKRYMELADKHAIRVVELEAALKGLLDRDMRNTCMHEETHRGGYLWEICDSCGAKWADDEGGKPEWEDPPEWTAARNAHDCPFFNKQKEPECTCPPLFHPCAIHGDKLIVPNLDPIAPGQTDFDVTPESIAPHLEKHPPNPGAGKIESRVCGQDGCETTREEYAAHGGCPLDPCDLEWPDDIATERDQSGARWKAAKLTNVDSNTTWTVTQMATRTRFVPGIIWVTGDTPREDAEFLASALNAGDDLERGIEGRLQGLEEAMKAVCDGCRMDWPLSDWRSPQLWRHSVPNENQGGKWGHVEKCSASPIRALRDQAE